MVSHDIKKGEGIAQVVCVVLNGLGDGLANSLEASKVNDKVNGVLVKDVVECICIVDVCLVERKALSVFFSHYGFDAIDNLCRSIGKVINNYGLVAGIEQFNNGVAANKARATGDKYAGILWNQSVRHINPFVDLYRHKYTAFLRNVGRCEHTGFSPGARAPARVSRRTSPSAIASLTLHYARLKSAKNLYLRHRFFDKIRQIHRFFYLFRQKLQILCRNQARSN